MKLFIIVFLLIIPSFAKEIEATYKISFGIFGQIGEAKATMYVDKQGNYTIEMLAKASGLASALSGERKEWFLSRGKRLKNGMLRPLFYEHKVTRGYQRKQDDGTWKKDQKTKIKQFKFNHEEQIVLKKQTKIRNEKVNAEPYKNIEYYADNDLLSLFFNFKTMSNNFAITKAGKMYAVGANKKDGRVDIIPPVGKGLTKLQEDLELKNGHFYITYINQKIFSSERGELYVNLNDDGICKKAILKNVIFFGDITGELVSLHVKD